jgi:hypothetical protein
MAQQTLDQTGNEPLGVTLSKINSMFTEQYTNVSDPGGTKTAAATAGAATLSRYSGVVTSESITTAAGSNYTLTLTNTLIAAADQVFVSVSFGTNTQGTPYVSTVTPAAGSVVIVIKNDHATLAFNGTIKVQFLVVKN